MHEAGDAVGGRVRTDVVDGMLLDRGFQVHNTGYPEAQRVLDHAALDLRRFVSGALVRVGDRLHRVGDPRRVPGWAPATVAAPIGTLPTRCASALSAVRAGARRPDRLLDAPETTTAQALRDRGFSPTVVDRFFRPFLSGRPARGRAGDLQPLLRPGLALVRPRQRSACPPRGMGAIPQQLADRLPSGGTGPSVEPGASPWRTASPAPSSSPPTPAPPASCCPACRPAA